MVEIVLGKLKTEGHRKLLSSSILIFAGSVVGYGVNYLYNVVMGRLLGPAEYGHLSALVALLYIVTFPLAALNTVIIRFVTAYKNKGQFDRIVSVLTKLNQKFTFIGLGFLVLIMLNANFLKDFFKLPDIWGLFLLGLLISLSFNSTVNMGVLSGLLNFRFISLLNSIIPPIKLIAAVILVLWGLKANGALLGLLLTTLIGFAISFLPLRFLWKYKMKETEIDWKEIQRFGVPAFLAILFFTSMANVDVLLVKHYFSETEAGLYSALSLAAKVIFFISGPINTVLFPVLVESKEKQGKSDSVFWMAFGLIGLSALTLTTLYWINPRFWLGLLFGAKYLESASFLPLFGVFMTLYSLDNALLSYYLSVNKTRVYVLTLLAFVLQIISIILFHNSFIQIILASTVVAFILLLGLVSIYWVKLKNNTG